MTPRPFTSGLLLGVVSLLAACSWSRFDDIQERAPVVKIESPGGIPGFATRMSAVGLPTGSRVLLGGDPNTTFPMAAFDVVDDRPSTEPADSAFCTSDCVSGETLTALREVSTPGGVRTSCFLHGAGDLDGVRGILGRCADGTNFVYPVPEDGPIAPGSLSPRDVIDDALVGNIQEGLIQHAASHDDAPIVVASAPQARSAWFYPAGSLAPVLLVPPAAVTAEPGADFGARVAVASVAGGAHLIAVSAPRHGDANNSGALWLYRLEPGGSSAAPWGCLSGRWPSFGRYMYVGQLTGDDSDELVVADAGALTVYDAGLLAARPLPDACGAPPLDTDALIARVTCVDGAALSGCDRETIAFGRALAVGDVDGDGHNELVVGVKELNVNDASGAGAVLVYRISREPQRSGLIGALMIATAARDDALGASVATVRIGERDIVAAGAPGAGAFFLFFCPATGGPTSASFRCQQAN